MSAALTNPYDDAGEEHGGRHSMNLSFGRPLSTIESIASSAEDEEEGEVSGNLSTSSENDIDDMKHTQHSADAREIERNTDHENKPDLKTQVDELMRLSNTLEVERSGKSSSSSTSTEGRSSGSIRLKDLPKLLREYEREKGQALLNDEARPVLDDYVQASPDVVLKADSLQQMIAMLNETRAGAMDSNAGDETVVQGQEESESKVGIERRQISTNSESETDATSSNEDDFSYDPHPYSESTVHPEESAEASTRASYQFPRSQSERKVSTNDGESGSRSQDSTYTPMLGRSKRTISDPSAPPLATHNRRVSASAISNGNKETREKKKSSDGIDKEVLRGKGKAKIPPHSWSNARPRPPALARRDRHRRISDLSSARSDDFDQENPEGNVSLGSADHQQSTLGLGTPSRPPRHRLSSQPEVLREINGFKLPRSASSASTGFVFPRALSLQYDDEDRLSEDDDPSPLTSSLPRKASSRAASPGLDEQSYHNFSALSPTLNNEYPSSPPLEGRSSRRSSGAGRRRTLIGDEADASIKNMSDSIAIRARLEAVSRQLAEKERQYDSIQQEHEVFISRLQDELDESKALLNTKRREEKDSKARENSHMDSIANLEADLNKTEKALETTREQLAKSRADYDEQVVETGRLRGKLGEVLEDVERLKTEERMHGENAKMWESDRESYRDKISLLHAQIDKIEDETVKMQDSQRENKVLKEQLERLTIEIDELRRGSSLMGSIRSKGSEVNGTLSKRLSSELARQLASASEEEVESDDTEEGLKTGDGDGDESVEHIYLVERRKSKKNRARTETQQTSSEPPTYDEAAHEKQVSDRLHPPGNTLSSLNIPEGKYKDLVQQTGRRCTVIESHLQQSSDQNISSASTSFLLFKAYCKDFMLHLIPYLPISTPKKSQLKTLIAEDSDSRSMSAFLLLQVFLIIVCVGLVILISDPRMHSSRTTAKDGVFEDWWVSNALELPWGSQGPPLSYQSGFLDWFLPSHRYDPTIRMPT